MNSFCLKGSSKMTPIPFFRRITFKGGKAKFINNLLNALIVVFFISTFSVFMKCDLCKIKGSLPQFHELSKVEGIYVPVYGRHLPLGGIRLRNRLEPIVCGFFKEEFQNHKASGWIDERGGLYQIEIDNQIVCSYQEVINSAFDAKRKFLWRVGILLALILLRVGIQFKLDKWGRSRFSIDF